MREWKLFFHRNVVWGHDVSPGKHVVDFADEKAVETTLNRSGNIGDWWNPADLPNALVAWSGVLRDGQSVGLHAFAWDNPRPEAEVASLDFISGGGAVPALVAVTGLEPE